MQDERREIGGRLLAEPLPRVQRQAVALAQGVTERTVRNWMKSSQGPPRRQGRPAHDQQVRWQALLAVARERRKQGRTAGWRPIDRALGGQVPTRLVQEMLSQLKAHDRRRHAAHLAPQRRSVRVLCRDTIWTEDGTHLGRVERSAVQAEVVKDRASLRTVALSVGSAANGEDVLLLLKTAKEKQGELPLVLQTDNGSSYCSTVVQEFLAAERVVHLRSRVRRPTDNGSAEIGMKELKAEAGLGRGARLPDSSAAALQLALTADRLNRYRLRGSRSYLTSQALARMFSPWYKKVARVPFYEEATTAMAEAREGLQAPRARLAERDAVFAVLEKHGLVVTTRGGRSTSPPKWEIIL